jgi:ribosomal protein S18 acetylase RimI-like enzyme
MATQLAIRDVTIEDTDAILDLMTEVDLVELGEPEHTAAEVRPPLTEDFRGWVAEDGDGIAGYAWVQRRPDHQNVQADVTVRPGRHDMYQPFLELIRPTAKSLDAELPLQIGTSAQMGAKRRVLEAAGGRIVRRFLRLGIELADEPPPRVPETPAGVEIVPLTDAAADLHAMHGVVDAAFLDHFNHASTPFDEWLSRTSTVGLTDRSLWWLAYLDGRPASGLMAKLVPSGGYIDTLGTLREHRGSGLGRALVLTAFAGLHARGARKVTLGVDVDNATGALELYRSLGMAALIEGLLYELN